MTKLEVLKECYEMACHNLLCYSDNYLMSCPKVGYMKEWENAKEKVSLLEEIIKDYGGEEE